VIVIPSNCDDDEHCLRMMFTTGGLVVILGHGGSGIVRCSANSNSHGCLGSHCSDAVIVRLSDEDGKLHPTLPRVSLTPGVSISSSSLALILGHTGHSIFRCKPNIVSHGSSGLHGSLGTSTVTESDDDDDGGQTKSLFREYASVGVRQWKIGHGGTGIFRLIANSNAHGSFGSPHGCELLTVSVLGSLKPKQYGLVVVIIGGRVVILGHGGIGIVRLSSSSNSHGAFGSFVSPHGVAVIVRLSDDDGIQPIRPVTTVS